MSKWISVKERLPDNLQECLVWVNVSEDFQDGDEYAFYSLASFHKEGVYCYWQDTSNSTVARHITHWMPLPPAPSERPKGHKEE